MDCNSNALTDPPQEALQEMQTRAKPHFSEYSSSLSLFSQGPIPWLYSLR